LQERTRQARSERALTDGKPPNETSGQKKHVTLFHRSRRAQILRTRRCRKASAVTEVENVFNTIRARGCAADASVAGRPGRALANRAVDTLRDQSARSYRGRHRQNRCLHRRIWVDRLGRIGFVPRGDSGRRTFGVRSVRGSLHALLSMNGEVTYTIMFLYPQSCHLPDSH
jgi:hypothetical protein